MQYTIKTRTRTDNATVEFYFAFDEYDGFANYLLKQGKKVKQDLNALAVAVALEKNVLRVIMPVGTIEKDFLEKAKKVIQFYYNMFSMSSYSRTTEQNYADLFGSLFGGFGGKKG